MYNTCVHNCGDEDCRKCFIHGIIFSCGSCNDYKSALPKEVEEEEERMYKLFFQNEY